MTQPLSEEDLQRRARRRVDAKIGFYIHATVFVLVNSGLAALSTLRGEPRWHLWTLAGWGLGLAIHGIVVFVRLRGEGLRERMLADEVDRLRRSGR